MSAPCPTFGFILRLLNTDAGDGAAARAALGRVLDEHGLVARSGAFGEIVVTREGSQATDADRQQVIAWAAQFVRDVRVDVSDIVDLSDL